MVSSIHRWGTIGMPHCVCAAKDVVCFCEDSCTLGLKRSAYYLFSYPPPIFILLTASKGFGHCRKRSRSTCGMPAALAPHPHGHESESLLQRELHGRPITTRQSCTFGKSRFTHACVSLPSIARFLSPRSRGLREPHAEVPARPLPTANPRDPCVADQQEASEARLAALVRGAVCCPTPRRTRRCDWLRSCFPTRGSSFCQSLALLPPSRSSPLDCCGLRYPCRAGRAGCWARQAVGCARALRFLNFSEPGRRAWPRRTSGIEYPRSSCSLKRAVLCSFSVVFECACHFIMCPVSRR